MNTSHQTCLNSALSILLTSTSQPSKTTENIACWLVLDPCIATDLCIPSPPVLEHRDA